MGETQTRSRTRQQLLRYGIVGLGSNAALYAAYLLLTSQGIGPKAAMTTVYCAGVLASFIFNRQWTFGHDGAMPGAMIRYFATYAIAYALNVTALYLLVDVAGLSHARVMLALIFVGAGAIFLMQKFWVFPSIRQSARR